MVVKGKHLLNNSSVRRSFRTRPSVQFPVILVDHHDVKLFGDDSFEDDFALRSPSAPKPRKKKNEPPKAFSNVSNLPAISELHDDEPMLEKLVEEIDMANDFSLYIENEEGVRMKAVGDKLVRYDEYYGKKSSESNAVTKCNEKTSLTPSEREHEFDKYRKATFALVGRRPPLKPKTADPIEELTEPDSVETLFVGAVGKENRECTNATNTSTLTTTPHGRASMIPGRRDNSSSAFVEAGDAGVTPLHHRTFRNLSTSPLPDLEHMQEPGCSSTPMLAQSTPLTERFSGSSPTKSSSGGRDTFDGVSDCVLPTVPSVHTPPRRSKANESDSSREDDPMDDSDDSDLVAAFDRSLQLSSGHNDSCGTLATLAEDVPFQC
ncbi:hypothetical protein OSTOST_06738, partial [Ostertagia ostertagi]